MGALRRWLGGSQKQPRDLTIWQWLSNHVDPLAALISLKGHPDMRYRMQVGYAAGGWRHTDSQTALLALGPPRSAAGKTAGIIIPTVLTQGGPVVTTSTKFDVARNTALARSRLGTVWYYDPSGGPTPPGFEELRWSPVAEASDWNSALEIGRHMMAASDVSSQAKGQTGSEVSHHFQERGGDLLGALLHFAALSRLDIDFIVDRITAYDLKNEILPVAHKLAEMGADQASRLLRGVTFTEDRERSGIFSTVSVALRGYQGRARRTAKNVNFSPVDFVKGKPTEPSDLHIEAFDAQGNVLSNAGVYPRLLGRYDTVYITVPADKQGLYAPLVIGLLSAIKRATYDLHRHDLMHGQTGLRQPVTAVLDEMYGFPVPDIVSLLAEGGGQGFLLCGALQDLSQAVARWGVAGEGFLTLWQNVVVMPGIRHGPTLELLSLLVGDYDRIAVTRGQSQSLGPLPLGFQRRIWMASESETIQRERILPPDAIYRGNPQRKREVLVFSPNGGWQRVDMMRFWLSDPWPSILMQSAEWSLRTPNAKNWQLPLPELALGGNTTALYDTGGSRMVEWWREIEAEWKAKQQRAIG